MRATLNRISHRRHGGGCVSSIRNRLCSARDIESRMCSRSYVVIVRGESRACEAEYSFNLAIYYFSYRPSQNLLLHTRPPSPTPHPKFSAPPRKLAHLLPCSQLRRQLYLYVNPRSPPDASQHHQRRRSPPPTNTAKAALSLFLGPLTPTTPSHTSGNGAPPSRRAGRADRAPPHALAEPAPAVRGPGDAGAGPLFRASARPLRGRD